MTEKLHILFVCGRNRWRSPTAEFVYRNDARVDVRSAGVSEKSRHTISSADIHWADQILVMESRYKTRISEMFHGLPLPPMENLDIPDEYEYMDSELVEMIKMSVESVIQKYAG